jgi:hypothetical protein
MPLGRVVLDERLTVCCRQRLRSGNPVPPCH